MGYTNTWSTVLVMVFLVSVYTGCADRGTMKQNGGPQIEAVVSQNVGLLFCGGPNDEHHGIGPLYLGKVPNPAIRNLYLGSGTFPPREGWSPYDAPFLGYSVPSLNIDLESDMLDLKPPTP